MMRRCVGRPMGQRWRVVVGRPVRCASSSAKKASVSTLTGIPKKLLERKALIHQPPRNTMQSGVSSSLGWRVEFDQVGQWRNPLMGWASGGDPLTQVKLNFDSLEAAKTYCDQNAIDYEVASRALPKQLEQSYATNFSYKPKEKSDTDFW